MPPVTVTIPQLQQLAPSLKAESVWKYLSRSKKGNRKEWQQYKNDSDRRQTFILYNTIPTAFRQKYELPATEDVQAELTRCQQTTRQTVTASQPGNEVELSQLARLLSHMVEQNYLRYISDYAAYHSNHKERAETYAKEHALRAAVMVVVQSPGCKKGQLHQAYLQLSAVRTIGNLCKFSTCINHGWILPEGMSLMHGHKGTERPQRRRMTDKHIAKIEELYSHPNGYSHALISEYLDNWCKLNGLVIISESTVSAYLKRPEVKNRLMFYRNREQFNKHVQPINRRSKAEHPADLYYMDGSPSQIPCLSRDGKRLIRPTIFVVLDQHSGKIVGFEVAENEDRYTWMAAMHMAFSMEKVLPYEIVYDNASATDSEEYRQLKAGLELMGCHLNPTKKANPTAKANVERWFGVFQTRYQIRVEGYVGEGIRSTRPTGRVDPEFLKQVRKENGDYTFDGLVQIIALLISAYNQTAAPRRKAPSEVYAQSSKQNAIPVSPEQLATLFWKHKAIKVSRGEVAFTVRGREHIYEVYDHEMAIALAGQQVRVYYDEREPSEVHIFTLDGEYLGELRQKTLIVSAKANQSEQDVQSIIKSTSHNKAIATHIRKKTAQNAAPITDSLLNLTHPLQALKDEFNNAETAQVLSYIGDSHNAPEELELPQPVKLAAPFVNGGSATPDLNDRYKHMHRDNNPSLEVIGEI